jgi:hypothetical protein
MPKGTAFDNAFLQLIFNATTMTGVAANATSPITNLYVSLHTADPSAGTQSTSEIAYTSYARVAVARTSGGWTVTGASVVPAAAISFPASTGGASVTATNFAIGTLSTGAGVVLWAGTITPNISGIVSGVTPILAATSSVTES